MTTDPLSDVAEGILRHDRFREAALHYTTALLSWRHGPRLLNKISGTHTRSQIVGYIMYLHFEAMRAPDEIGATYQRLWRLCERRRDCSPRVLKTVLAMLRLAGMVTVARSETDGRLKIYRPQPRMIELMQHWYGQTFGCFDILCGGGDYAGRVRADPQFLADVIVDIARPYIALDILLVKQFPDIYDLFSMDAGFIVGATLVEASLRNLPPPSANVIARGYGSSASQVRNILLMLQQRGLVTITADGKIADSAPLVSLFCQHIARELSLYARYALGLAQVFAGGSALAAE